MINFKGAARKRASDTASALAALSADLGEPMAPAEVSEMRLALQAGEDSAGVVTFSDFAAFWNSD